MVTVITPTASIEVPTAVVVEDDLWLDAGDLDRVTGYELKPEGFCRDDVCVPVPAGREAEFLRPNGVNLATLWRHLGGAVVHDASAASWSLGDAPADHHARLDALEAPDFTLPDVSGALHSLRDYRGQKVLLAAWASW